MPRSIWKRFGAKFLYIFLSVQGDFGLETVGAPVGINFICNQRNAALLSAEKSNSAQISPPIAIHRIMWYNLFSKSTIKLK